MDAIPKGTVAVILIVPVLNRYDLLQRMIDSIDTDIDHLLIIDNGGTLTTLNVPNYVEKLTILNMPSNLGVAASWNLGIKCFPFAQTWTITSADTVFLPGALKTLELNSWPHALTLTADFPHYQAFSVGEDIVQEVGLFDESIYPIYFEDNDYQRRVERAGFDIIRADVKTQHDNSSTIHSDAHYRQRNAVTFGSNERYYNQKVNEGDFSEGRWNLERIRSNNWDK